MAQARETQGPTRTTEALIAELQRRLVELRAAQAELDRVIASVQAA